MLTKALYDSIEFPLIINVCNANNSEKYSGLNTNIEFLFVSYVKRGPAI